MMAKRRETGKVTAPLCQGCEAFFFKGILVHTDFCPVADLGRPAGWPGAEIKPPSD